MEPPPKFSLKGYFGKPFKIIKNRNSVRESIVRGEGVRHPTAPVQENGYPKLII